MPTVQLPAGTHQLYDGPAIRAVQLARTTGGVVKPEVAMTIAAWWQSPGRVGCHLATLASGLRVDTENLLDDIDATMGEVDPLDFASRASLEALRAWVLSQAAEQ